MSNIRIKTEVEMFPREYNWIKKFKLTGWMPISHLYFRVGVEMKKQWIYCQWYERPNEDHLLNTLTDALELADKNEREDNLIHNQYYKGVAIYE